MGGWTPVTVWSYLAAYPPTMVRLCARRSTGGKHVAAMSTQEIALSSGLPAARIAEISLSLNWDDITISEAKSFCAACNFDPTRRLDRDKQARYANICRKRTPGMIPHYLRISPYWETEFKHLIRHLQMSSEPSGEAGTLSPTTMQSSRKFDEIHAVAR